MSDSKGNSFGFPSGLVCYTAVFSVILRENKTNWFPEGPDIKCFVI